MDPRKYFAELVGTFLFLGIGLTAIQAVGALQAPAVEAPILLVVPFAFGLGLLAAIFAVGHVSGGHFNPAVTLAMALDGRTSPVDAVGYIVAQIVGAIGSALLVLALFSQDAVKATITQPGHGFDDAKALVLETVLTAIFVLVILASTRRASSLAALAIPLTLVAIHFVAVPFSGSSVNPARSIAPALVGGDLSHLWVYIVAPLIGAVIGWAVWEVLESSRFGRGPAGPGAGV